MESNIDLSILKKLPELQKQAELFLFFGAFAAFYSSGAPLSCVQKYQNTRDRPRKTCTG